MAVETQLTDDEFDQLIPLKIGDAIPSGIKERLGISGLTENLEPHLVDYAKRLRDRSAKALEIILQYGSVDGGHHKAWVIDQVTRALTADGYEKFVTDAKAGEDGPNTYEWDEGIPP